MIAFRKMATILTIFTIIVSMVTFILSEISYSAQCTADYGNGYSVSCSGQKCSATDGSGCAGWDSNGKVKTVGFCIQ